MNPYSTLPKYCFWKSSVSGRQAEEVDPITRPPFLISKTDAVATAGSCFAQHIARTLTAQGFNYLLGEPAPAGRENDATYGMFSARYGNVYSARQLLQLIQRVGEMLSHKLGTNRRDMDPTPFNDNLRNLGVWPLYPELAKSQGIQETMSFRFPDGAGQGRDAPLASVVAEFYRIYASLGRERIAKAVSVQKLEALRGLLRR